MHDEPPFTFDWLARLVRDFFALLGFVMTIGLIAFFFGYMLR